jgi:hypothetical protein
MNGKKVRPEPIRLEIRNDRLSEKLMLARTGIQIYRVYGRLYSLTSWNYYTLPY